MGISLSWVALTDGSPNQLRDSLGFELTDQSEEYPESPFVEATLPSKIHLIILNKGEVSEKQLVEASNASEIIHGMVDDHCMVSSLACWKNGEECWYVAHDEPKGGILDLQVRGDLPSVFDDIKEEQFKAQEDEGGAGSEVDYIFDIPVYLGDKLVGFRSDADVEYEVDNPYKVLRKKKGSGLFGLFKKG